MQLLFRVVIALSLLMWAGTPTRAFAAPQKKKPAAGKKEAAANGPAPGEDTSGSPAADPNLAILPLLRCPSTLDRLEYDPEGKRLISRKSGLAYPVVEGIPILLREKATALSC